MLLVHLLSGVLVCFFFVCFILFIINVCWILSKSFLCIFWDNHMLLFQFVNMVFHIDWFVFIEEPLHPWVKAYLITMYDSFIAAFYLLIFFQLYLLIFHLYIHQWYWPVIFFFCNIFDWFCYHGDRGFLEWVWECSSFCNFLEEFEDRF